MPGLASGCVWPRTSIIDNPIIDPDTLTRLRVTITKNANSLVNNLGQYSLSSFGLLKPGAKDKIKNQKSKTTGLRKDAPYPYWTDYFQPSQSLSPLCTTFPNTYP